MAKDSSSFVTLLLVGGAAFVGYKWWTGSSAATAPAAPSPGLPAGPSSDALFQQVLAAATADAKAGNTANQLGIVKGQTQTIFSAWNYYTSRIGGFLDLPDYTTLTNNPDPGPITGAQYWGIMGPWLKKNHGLSGVLAGLGEYILQQRSAR